MDQSAVGHGLVWCACAIFLWRSNAVCVWSEAKRSAGLGIRLRQSHGVLMGATCALPMLTALSFAAALQVILHSAFMDELQWCPQVSALQQEADMVLDAP